MIGKIQLNIALLVSIAIVDFFGLGVVLTAFAPLFLSAHGIFQFRVTHAERLYWLGIAFAMAPLGQLFSTPILGALSDRWGRKTLLLITLVGTSLSIFTCIYAIVSQWLSLLLFGRLLTGIFAGNVAIAQASLADITKNQDKAWRFNFLQIGIGLGMLLGPLFGGKLIFAYTPQGFAKPFYASLFLTLILLLLVIIFYRDTLPKAIRRSGRHFSWLAGPRLVATAFTTKSIKGLLLGWFVFMLGWDFYVQFFTNFLQESTLRFSSSQVGNLFSYLGVVYLLCQVIIVQPSTKFFMARKVYIPASFLVALFIFLMGLSGNPVTLYSMLTLYVISIAMFIPNFNAVLSQRANDTQQGTVFGMSVALHALSTIIISLIGGVLLVYSVRVPLLGGGCLMLIATFVFIVIAQAHKNRQNRD